MHNAAVTGLESQITSMITNYLDIILLYEARVDSTNLANSYSQDSLILLHSIEMSNQANSLDSLNTLNPLIFFLITIVPLFPLALGSFITTPS